MSTAEKTLERINVDLDSDIPCGHKVSCDRPAEWDVRHPCCDARALLCTPHKERHQKRSPPLGGHSMICGGCGKDPMPLPTFRKL